MIFGGTVRVMCLVNPVRLYDKSANYLLKRLQQFDEGHKSSYLPCSDCAVLDFL
jgi:hypothetical protein